LRNVAEFAKEVGAKKEAAAFEELQGRLEADKRLSQCLREDLFHARGLASYWIPSHIRKQKCDAAKIELLNAQYSRLKQALDSALMPAKPAAFPKTNIQGLAG